MIKIIKNVLFAALMCLSAHASLNAMTVDSHKAAERYFRNEMRHEELMHQIEEAKEYLMLLEDEIKSAPSITAAPGNEFIREAYYKDLLKSKESQLSHLVVLQKELADVELQLNEDRPYARPKWDAELF